MRNLFIFVLLVISCSKNPEPNTASHTAESCIEKDCQLLDESGYACFESKETTECRTFLAVFEKLLGPYSCDGKIDPQLNINHCGKRPGATYVDVHFKRLSELDDAKAIALYASEKFRKVLDGNSAEEHYANSLKQEMILNPQKLPAGYKVECIEYERKMSSRSVVEDFKKFKKAEFTKYEIKDYQISLGQFGLYVSRNNKECHTEIQGEVRDEQMKKFKHFDVVTIPSYGFEKKYETVVDLATCKILWQAEVLFESLEMNSAPKGIVVSKADPGSSPFNECSSCWSKKNRECKSY